jgi:hypothetical protein
MKNSTGPTMRIALTYNLRTDETEAQSEMSRDAESGPGHGLWGT